MKKSKLNFIVDALAFITFTALISTGIILFFKLPPGSGKHKTIWNLDRHEWGDIHFWIALSLLLILTYHLFLHWRWIKSLVQGKRKQYTSLRKRLALITLLFIWAMTFSPVFSPVKDTKGGKDNKPSEAMSHTTDTLTDKGYKYPN